VMHASNVRLGRLEQADLLHSKFQASLDLQIFFWWYGV
jgi:hypothetical protein